MAFTLFLSALKADLISGAVAAILGHEVLSMRMKVSILMMVEWKDTKSMGSLMAQLSSWSNARNYLHSDFLILEKIKPFCLNHQSNAVLMPFILISVFQFSLEESPFFHSHSCNLKKLTPSLQLQEWALHLDQPTYYTPWPTDWFRDRCISQARSVRLSPRN